MVGVRVVGMRVGQPLMLVNMGMGSLDRWLVLVSVVFVMDVFMLVFQGFVPVDMVAVLREVQVDLAPHEKGCRNGLHR